MKVLVDNYSKQKMLEELMKRYRYQTTCPHCKSELEYIESDICAIRTPGGKRWIVCGACLKDITI